MAESREVTVPSGPSGDPDEVAGPVGFLSRAKLAFPVVGIGASAGGIEALRLFFEAVPADTGMAFVVVQHLPPDRESLMAEILSRHSSMPVHQIQDGMQITSNAVYLIRPGFTVTLEDGTLRLGEPVEKRGHRRPVDDFFRSLAREQQEKSIAVVLSGMGTNGAAGAQAIKAAGGLCIAQEPASADFPGMPQSLINAGYADRVLKAEEIPAVLVQYIAHPYLDSSQDTHQQAELALLRDRQHLNETLAILRTRTGHDFSGYKKPTILRRMQRRMGLAAKHTLAQYAAYLRDDAEEVQSLANDLMINVTGFFRDPQAWEALRAAIQPWIEQRSENSIRAWVTACSSGEEAYSLAILLAEEVERAGKRFEIKIFATDTADKSVALARAGIYPGGIEGDVSTQRLERFFDKDEHTYRLKREIRDMIVFAPQDVLRDPPFSKVDICTCRNLLIYLEPEVQRRVLKLMHFALREGGYLFLGNAETLGIVDKTFETISKKWRIYRRIGPAQHQFVDLANLYAHTLPDVRRADAVLAPLVRPVASATSIQQSLLDQFAPPTVVVDRHDRIIYFHGDTAAYLAQPRGEPTHDLFEVLRPAYRSAVRNILRSAAAENIAVTVVVNNVGREGAPTQVQLTAAPLHAIAHYLRITFDAAAVPRPQPAALPVAAGLAARAQSLPLTDVDGELENELSIVRRELQNTIEAFEASNEELKASHEEVISINEELQSANEELETGKEELQSVNEELVMVNGQLQSKILELEATTNDLTNLLSSTSIAVVFLDVQLRVRRFTPAVNDLLALIPADTGRPIAHLAQKFNGADLVQDAQSVLATLVPLESETRSHSDTWYLRRILPYRTSDNRIDGVVITFVDITARKHAEQALQASQARLQAVVEHMPAAMLLVETPSAKLLFGNRGLAKLFGLPFPVPFVGSDWMTVSAALNGYGVDGHRYLPHEWPLSRTLASGEVVEDEEIAFRQANGTTSTFLASSTPVRDASGQVVAAVAAFWDITARKLAAEALRASEERCRLLVESATDYAIFTTDLQGSITSWNIGAERLLGWTEQQALHRSVAIIFTPEDRKAGAVEQEMQCALQNDRATDERQHVRKDGTRFWASGILTRLTNANGVLQGFAKIMRDNTERREARDELQKALRDSEAIRTAVESANRAKDEFISTVSHELRTPLNTIRLWSRMLSSGRLPHEDWAEGVKIIDRSALAQQQLIDDLLDVSRMSSGQLRLALHASRLIDTVKNAIEVVQPSADARQITILAQLGNDVGVVRADSSRMQQIIWNLLNNAVKFTPAGGRIVVSVARYDTEVEMRVTDSGIGIQKEFLPYVFDRFRQAEVSTTRLHGGLGLGLSIVKQLVEAHGGSISAHSEGEGHGATFIVRLPLKRLDGEAEATEDAHAELPKSDLELRGVRILLVEDDAATLDATGRVLEMHGAQVQALSSAATARDAYVAQPPQLLICDIGLPGEDGFSLIQEIRSLEHDRGLPRAPALALTAFVREEDKQHALTAGFDRHLGKPVEIGPLIDIIRALISEAK